MNESKFTGGLLGYLGTSLLALLIATITLGIGIPWAVCIMEEWKARHTIIDGKNLYFDGKGSQLFGNFIKWFLLTIVTLGIYGFWLVIKMKQWTTMHTHAK